MAAATCNFMLAQCLSDLDGGLADADWRGDHLPERGRCPRTWPGKHGGIMYIITADLIGPTKSCTYRYVFV